MPTKRLPSAGSADPAVSAETAGSPAVEDAAEKTAGPDALAGADEVDTPDGPGAAPEASFTRETSEEEGRIDVGPAKRDPSARAWSEEAQHDVWSASSPSSSVQLAGPSSSGEEWVQEPGAEPDAPDVPTPSAPRTDQPIGEAEDPDRWAVVGAVAQPDPPTEPAVQADPTDAPASAPAAGPGIVPARPGTIQGAIEILRPHLLDHRAALITGAVLGTLGVLLLVAFPIPLKVAVDAAVGTGAASTVTTSVGILVGILAALTGAVAGGISALSRAGTRATTALRAHLLAHVHGITGAGPGTVRGEDTSAVSGQHDEPASRPLIDDVGRLRDLFSVFGPRIAGSLLGIAASLVALLIMEPWAALVVAVTAAVYALIARPLTRGARAAQRHATAEDVRLADTTAELVSATRTVQSYGLEKHAQRTLAEVGVRAGRARAVARRTEAATRLSARIISGLGVAALLLVLGPRVEEHASSAGDLVLSLAYLLITMALLRELAQHTGTLTSAAEAGDRIGALLEQRGSIAQAQRTQTLDRARGEIVYSAITAQGPRGDALFDTVSLMIPAGQHVALMAGEDTEADALLSYLQRFEEPATGRVLVDRYDTRALALADLRRQIAVVQREPALFTDTVRENIRIGRPGASDDEVVLAARRAGIEDLIGSLPDGYDTLLIQRGSALSDGQRRRLAVARALLRDAPIVVLDQADADLAPRERDEVLDALDTLITGRTAIISSRQAETLLGADRIVWFAGGVIVEDASPAELSADPDSHFAHWLRRAADAG